MAWKELIVKNIFSSISLVFLILLGLSATARAHTDVSVSEAQEMVNEEKAMMGLTGSEMKFKMQERGADL